VAYLSKSKSQRLNRPLRRSGTSGRSAVSAGLSSPPEENVPVALEPPVTSTTSRGAVAIRRRGWLVRRLLLLADLVGLTVAFVLAETFLGPQHVEGVVRPELELLLFLATLPAWAVMAKLYGLYERDEERTDHSTADDLVGVFHLVTVGAWLFYALSRQTEVVALQFEKLLLFWVLAIVLVSVGRSVARFIARRSLFYLQNTIIVGAGDIGQLIGRKILRHPEYGLNLVGFVDSQPKVRRDDLDHLTLLGDTESLAALIQEYDVERVVIAFSNDTHEETLGLIRSLKDLEVQVDIVPRLFEVVGTRVGIHTLEGLPIVGLPPLKLSRTDRAAKRGLDVAIAGLALLVLAPVFAVIAIAIKLDSSGPVFFRQLRRGRGQSTFRIVKFRTMVVDAEERKTDIVHLNRHLEPGGDPRMFKADNDPRVTRVGRVLRRYSVDELPQLINVLRGNMSLVGPRPLILDEDQFVREWGLKRVDLKPGMTGLWQVAGSSRIPFGEMIRLDYLYVTNWSLWSDFRLMLRTVPAVMRSGGGAH
jgi:exopolysaccharide biosynthesis polyprenyl glycosylphosphotransferase